MMSVSLPCHPQPLFSRIVAPAERPTSSSSPRLADGDSRSQGIQSICATTVDPGAVGKLGTRALRYAWRDPDRYLGPYSGGLVREDVEGFAIASVRFFVGVARAGHFDMAVRCHSREHAGRRTDLTCLFVHTPVEFPNSDANDRGLTGHRVTQNALAQAGRDADHIPMSTAPGAPAYDLAWREADVFVFAEVKSLIEDNEVGQLRLGLGQVLDYTHQMRAAGNSTKAILAVGSAPSDDRWADLCAEHDVVLMCPEFDISRPTAATHARIFLTG